VSSAYEDTKLIMYRSVYLAFSIFEENKNKKNEKEREKEN